MTRLGWIVLTLIVLIVAGFASLTSFGGGSSRPVKVAPGVAPASGEALVVPVSGVERSSLVDSWGDSRGGGARGHHGTDIPAGAGTPVLAAAPGVVEKLFESRLGGTTLYIRSTDARWIYYYAHLAGYAPGLVEGRAVKAGDRIAFVGDTGDAGPGNFHLHFGVQRMHPGERWWEGEDVNPYPLLAGRGIGR